MRTQNTLILAWYCSSNSRQGTLLNPGQNIESQIVIAPSLKANIMLAIMIFVCSRLS
jgi:hypothetical protein